MDGVASEPEGSAGETRDAATALEKLAAALDGGGEARAGQVAMAEAVAVAVRDGRPLVVRAGTGTGKTWAYLVGALMETAAATVVVATATKALQDQLAGKDLPAVAAIGLRPDLTWAVLKGRSNYFCRQAGAEVERDEDPPRLGLESGSGGAGAPSVARCPGCWPGPSTVTPATGRSWPSSPVQRPGRR